MCYCFSDCHQDLAPKRKREKYVGFSQKKAVEGLTRVRNQSKSWRGGDLKKRAAGRGMCFSECRWVSWVSAKRWNNITKPEFYLPHELQCQAPPSLAPQCSVFPLWQHGKVISSIRSVPFQGIFKGLRQAVSADSGLPRHWCAPSHSSKVRGVTVGASSKGEKWSYCKHLFSRLLRPFG